jgi:hypothetical protein
MNWLWILLSIIVFFAVELLIYFNFHKNRKISEILSIVIFLISAFLVVNDKAEIYIIGGILMCLALYLDFKRNE